MKEKLVAEKPAPEANISFYVAECAEFPVMGEFHGNLTLEQALEIYDKIPAERMNGIRFIAINDNYDNANTESSDSDSIVVPFKNLLNDSYCRDISIKVRSQLDIKRRKGEFIGGYAVYGYSKDEQNKNRLVVDEYAADIVRSIYRRKLEGMSANSIADQLNSEGVLAPSEYKRLCGLNYHSGFKTGTHAKWQAIQVLRILKNEVYTGTMVQGKRQKINYKDAITLVSVI